MWIEAVAPERIAELFENRQSALGIVGQRVWSREGIATTGENEDEGIPRPQPALTEFFHSGGLRPLHISKASESGG